MEADFSGYATRNDIVCTDGKTIKPNSFKHQDQTRVPLVWQHEHSDLTKVLGHAILENRADGVYAYGFFNETPMGEHAKELVKHGDIRAMSIYANQLQRQGNNVLHGNIREVSLVLAGANEGAYIDNVNIRHGDDVTVLDNEVLIFTGLEFDNSIHHADSQGDTVSDTKSVEEIYHEMTEEQQNVVNFLVGEALDSTSDGAAVEHAAAAPAPAAAASGKTVEQVFNTLSEEQKNVVHYLIGEALNAQSATAKHSDDDSDSLQHSQKGSTMRNVFDQSESRAPKATLSHSDLETIVANAKRPGSTYKESFNDFIEHATYGIEDIEYLFPDARTLSNTPELIARQTEWVPKVLDATKKSPFAKIKSITADITAEEARAKGYVKGTEKKDEVVKLMRRTTGPTTVYKKQKLDRDDIIDITDLDVVAWLKWEIRFMLNEEIARAILIGDGRDELSEDKIKDPAGAVDGVGIRSIANDHAMYAHPVVLAANVSAEDSIDEVTRARTEYRGSGSPTMYTTDKFLTDLLLLKDKMGRRLYNTEAELASALRVKDIVTVEVLNDVPEILAIIVNLIDYTVGANKGGEISFFEDFDIDFNQNKYLMETRISGALTRPKSALVIKRQQGTAATPAAPSFNGGTNTITIPATTGIDYRVNGVTKSAGAVVITEDSEVVAVPKTGYYIPFGTTTRWSFTFTG
jgi:HK97 family phage prohead protease